MDLFSRNTLHHAWQRARGQCESPVVRNGRHSVCGRGLKWEQHGQLHLPEGWLGRPRILLPNGAPDVASNCEIICRGCHQAAEKTATLRLDSC